MFGSGFGLLAAVVAVALVLRVDPGNLRRAFLAGLLLLFLPVQLYMSAMLNEELVAAGFISLALFGLVWELSRDAPPSHPLLSAAGIGLAGGLALLTKLSGALIICVSVATFAAVAWRRGALGAGVARITVAGALALASGGWYFAHNWFVYGYLYPLSLIHI